MKRVIIFVFLLSGCVVAPEEEASLDATVIIPLYPAVAWTTPEEKIRYIDYGSGGVLGIGGWEITAMADDREPQELFFSESEHVNQDFWRYYLEDFALSDIGLDTVFLEEDLNDRSMVGLRNDKGHVAILSHILEFDSMVNGELDCPCLHRFTIFTNSELIVLP